MISSFRLPGFPEVLIMSSTYFYCKNCYEDLLFEVIYSDTLSFFGHWNNVNSNKQKSVEDCVLALDAGRDGKTM